MVVEYVKVKAETDSVLFERHEVKVKFRIVVAKEPSAQVDCVHIVLFVDKDKMLFLVYFEPTRLVVVVVVGDGFDSFVQRAYIVVAETVSDFRAVHSFDFSGYKYIQLVGRSNALPKVFDISRC
jgi:hypothetical protein